VRGIAVRSARGRHSGGLNPGDRMFVWAVHGEELHLLGAIRVTRGGRDWAEGRSLYGPFTIVPLEGLKWRLRFQHTAAEKLVRQTPIAMQVRARRHPTSKTVELLERLLSHNAEDIEQLERDSAVREGKQRKVTLSRRERSRKLRTHLLATRGHHCEICGFDFVKRYGEFAKHCVEIHHLELMSSSGRQGRMTSLEDLIVVCPNCHRALHQFGNSADWKAFRRACNLG
jgi:5-methylcytosine-specific restriction endonuclease McrA